MSMNAAPRITNVEGIPKERCAGRFFEVQSRTPEKYSIGMRRRCYLRIWKNEYVYRFNSLLLDARWGDIDLVAAQVSRTTFANLVGRLTQHECKSHHPYPSPNQAESKINARPYTETFTQIHDKMNDRVLVSDLRANSRNQQLLNDISILPISHVMDQRTRPRHQGVLKSSFLV